MTSINGPDTPDQGDQVTPPEQSSEEQLSHLKAALDLSYDHSAYLIDGDTATYLYANRAALRLSGFSREELIRIRQAELEIMDPDEKRQHLAAIIAAGEQGIVLTPTHHVSRDGELQGWWETRLWPVYLTGRLIIVSSSRDVTDRVLAEAGMARVKKMYAALIAAHEASLRVSSPDRIYQEVCNASVQAGRFVMAAVVLLKPASRKLRFAAMAGEGMQSLRDAGHVMDQHLDPASSEARGVAGISIDSSRPCISNDFQYDQRFRAWHSLSQQANVRAAAAVPMKRGDHTFGALLLCADVREAFDTELVSLLERIADGIGFALDNFDREVERGKAEEALRTSEEKYRSTLENIEDAYYEVDLAGNITLVNSSFSRMLGYPERELVGMNNRQFMSTEGAADVYRVFNQVYRTGVAMKAYDWEMIQPDGNRILTEASIQLIRNSDGMATGFRGILRDLTERRREESLLALEHAVTRNLAEVDSTKAVLQAVMRTICESEQWESAGFFTPEGTTGAMRLAVGWSGPGTRDTTAAFYREALGSIVPADGLLSEVYHSQRPLWVADITQDQRTRWKQRLEKTGERAHFSFPVLSEGEVVGIFGFANRAIRQPERRLLSTVAVIGNQVGQYLQRKKAEDRIRFLATHDSLTELPNRILFSRMLAMAIQNSQRRNHEFAVMFIDLDHFKEINDALGHDAGDILLQTTALRLSGAMRASDLVARMGGDEFVVLLQEIEGRADVEVVARKILSAITETVVIQGESCQVTASIGISMYPLHGTDETALMKHADAAMYQGKFQGKNTFQFFNPELTA